MREGRIVKPIRWTKHAEDALVERKIDRQEVEQTVAEPEFVVPGLPPCDVLMRRYHDARTGRQALIRVVVDETADELVIVTIYKASRFNRYLRGLVP